MKISTITKLKLISLCMGMMFWYGVEQLFMDNVLHDPAARAWTTFVFSATWLVFDIPGGIIADKFGRRRTLIMSSVFQVGGVIILAVSQSLPVYLIGAFLYGLHWSTFSGVAQALMYDHLLADEKHQEYAKHQGSVTAYGYIGATFANILSGIIADTTSLRMPYIVSIIPSIAALVIAVSLHEVAMKKQTVKRSVPLKQYATELIRTIRRTPIAAVYAIQIIAGAFVFMTICEFGQMFLLTFHISATVLGILWAIVAGVVAVGVHSAHHLQRWSWQTIAVYAGMLIAFGIISGPVAIILFMLVYVGTEIMHNIAETELQHVTTSHARATVLSSVTFLGNLFALPLILLFNTMIQTQSIQWADMVVSLVVAAGLLLTVVVLRSAHSKK